MTSDTEASKKSTCRIHPPSGSGKRAQSFQKSLTSQRGKRSARIQPENASFLPASAGGAVGSQQLSACLQGWRGAGYMSSACTQPASQPPVMSVGSGQWWTQPASHRQAAAAARRACVLAQPASRAAKHPSTPSVGEQASQPSQVRASQRAASQVPARRQQARHKAASSLERARFYLDLASATGY